MQPAHEDEYGRDIIAEGQRRGITPRGIEIALATVFVESDFIMYANEADPPSEMFFHEAESTDANSDGLFQQRDPWWGTAAQRMDPTASAGMFFDHLAKFDYNNTTFSPGHFAQGVQGSAYPDRYDQHWDEAVALYNRLTSGNTVVTAAATDPNRPDFNEYPLWSPNSQNRNGTKVDLFLLHTEEGHDNADSLARNVLDNPASQVAYHYTISEDPNDHGVTVVDVVDTDLASWSVLSANDRSINLCFAGSTVNWSRDEWIANAGKAIDVAAYLCVKDCQKYGIPLKVITSPYDSDPPGISDHRYVTEHLKDGTHVDLGNNFPWDLFQDSINKYAGAPVPDAPAPPPPPIPPAFEYPSTDEMVKQIWEQLLGPQAKGWYGLFGTSPEDGARGMYLVEAIAAIFKKAA